MATTQDAPAGDGPGIDGVLRLGRLVLDVQAGALRIGFDGVEAVRQIDCPLRDADWRTMEVVETGARREAAADRARLERRFRSADGGIDGTLVVVAESADNPARATVALELELTARRALSVNRVGFILLHPAAVAGAPLAVRHSDGSTEETRFPALISPGQPVFDIAGLRWRAEGVEVEIAMEGEVFEMEDQRNWTDASFKTYCRPLGRPRPFALAEGETVRQALRIALSGAAARRPAEAASSVAARAPEILLAHEAALADRPAPEGLAGLGVGGVLLRVDARAPDLSCPVAAPVTLEVVVDGAGDLAVMAAACAAAGIAPVRVVALPRAYLASHQPEGPWPEPRPMAFVAAARAAFPRAQVGGGALTNFTELNRCPPDPAAIDFATFGTTAIVHAADDRSVRETLEALPAIFASARALAGARPLHLGLVAVAMRSNPYGRAVAPNPERRRIAMATEDPRQRTAFAAAFALGAVAEAARAGVASLAPAMTAGPLAAGEGAERWPLFAAVAALAALAGQEVRIAGGPGGLMVIEGAGRRLAANLGPAPARFGGGELAPMDVSLDGPRG